MEDNENKEVFERLVSENYSYNNLMINPILKPIADADRSIMDLKEIMIKDLDEMSKEISIVNTLLLDIPEYQESPMVDKLMKIKDKMGTIIKIYGLIEGRYRECIKSVHETIKDKYGVIEEKSGKYIKPETIVPEGGPKQYLEKLLNYSDEKVPAIAKEILELFEQNKSEDNDKSKFDKACYKVYSKQIESSKKVIIAKIMRMEL